MRVYLPLLTVGELCPADNPLKMIYDYPFEMIYVLSLWNDIWLSLRKERQRPQSFWNDISTIALKWHFERNCLLHAFGVFRVFAYWILTKFNRQTPGWKNSLLSFRDDLWLSFRNDRAKFSYRGLFSSGKTPCILVTKITHNPHVFVHRFFRSDCPLAAWK